ncbi:MAG: HD domain-containing protein [Caldilineaceae bacterium]|nr:HD domain-containing protein [Caldilineaceae bacterium]
MNRLAQQLAFILELDKLKNVLRRSYITHNLRRENSAEHSWHIALTALTLAEHANEPIAIDHVIKLLLIHDIVEIDADDTFIYDTAGKVGQHDREYQAAQRIFGLLPAEQGEAYLQLWLEFEARVTPEAKFARAVDRLLPVLHNCYTEGRGWQENNIHQGQVRTVNRIIDEGATPLWELIQIKIQEAVDAGFLRATA